MRKKLEIQRWRKRYNYREEEKERDGRTKPLYWYTELDKKRRRNRDTGHYTDTSILKEREDYTGTDSRVKRQKEEKRPITSTTTIAR